VVSGVGAAWQAGAPQTGGGPRRVSLRIGTSGRHLEGHGRSGPQRERDDASARRERHERGAAGSGAPTPCPTAPAERGDETPARVILRIGRTRATLKPRCPAPPERPAAA
jgi:hypothetical protein